MKTTVNILACLAFSPLYILNIFENRLYMKFGALPSLNIKIQAFLTLLRGEHKHYGIRTGLVLGRIGHSFSTLDSMPSTFLVPFASQDGSYSVSSSWSPCRPLNVGSPQCSTLRLLPSIQCPFLSYLPPVTKESHIYLQLPPLHSISDFCV